MRRALGLVAGSSGSRRERGSASSGSSNDAQRPPARFRDDAAAANFATMRRNLKVHEPRFIDVNIDCGVPLFDLFVGTSLSLLLTLSVAFNPQFVMAFYANLYAKGHRSVKSYVLGREVEITSADLVNFLELSDEGPTLWPLFRADPDFDWREVNEVLQGDGSMVGHCGKNKNFFHDACFIQHVLRHTVFPKSGDVPAVNTTLSLATFFCMRKIPFDSAGAILEEIFIGSQQVHSRKPKKLPHGHVITYILEKKYGAELLAGHPGDHEMVSFKHKDIAQVLKRFRPAAARAGGGEERAEADVAGGEEEAPGDFPPQPPPFQPEVPQHATSPRAERTRHSFVFPAEHPPFRHQPWPYDEQRSPYFDWLGGNQEALYARQDTLLLGQQALHQETGELRQEVRRSLEEMRASIDRLTGRFGSWQNPPDPAEEDPNTPWSQSQWQRWP